MFDQEVYLIMFWFDAELKLEADGRKRGRAESLRFLEQMELLLILALRSDNPWAEGGIDKPLQDGLA